MTRAQVALLVVVVLVGTAGIVRTASRRAKHQPTSVASTTSLPPQSTPTPGPPPVEARSAALATELGRAWNASPGGCLTVRSGDKVLYEANPDAEVSPASVTKLLTAAAALEGLGQDTRLRTSVLADAAPVDGVVAGKLWLVGGGDPVLGTDAWARRSGGQSSLYTSLDALADRVLAAGVRQVEGGVAGDESRYDRDRYVDSWPARLIADGEAGPLSALTVNDGFRVWGHPGIPFADPPTDAAALFTELLVARGVAISTPPARGTAAGAVHIAGIESAPVGELVRAMLRDSDNGTAELLVKELGLRSYGDGSTAAGVRALRNALRQSGAPLQGVVIADGAGLSDAARLTCRSLTTLLAVRSADLAGRLPVAGREGTLARRFLNSPVAGRLRAKTGSLDGVAALAGYADNAGGATLSFSYIINGLPRGNSGRALQDAVATALVATR